MTVTVKTLSMKVPIILVNGLFEDPSVEVLHNLGEDIFALVHYSGRYTGPKVTKRSPQIVKCQRAI